MGLAERDGQPDNPNHPSPRTDNAWDEDQRGETSLQRLDRNWTDPVAGTAGHPDRRPIAHRVPADRAVPEPFQSRFEQLTQFQQVVYLITLSAAVMSTGFLIAPVSLHRFLFRRHARRVTVDVAHRLAQIGMVLLAVAVVAMVLLIFDVVSAFTAAVVAAGAATVLLAGLWVALPLAIRERGEDDSGRGRPPPLSAVRRPR